MLAVMLRDMCSRVTAAFRDPARPGLLVQQGLDLGLARAVLTDGGAGLVLRHRYPQRGARLIRVRPFQALDPAPCHPRTRAAQA